MQLWKLATLLLTKQHQHQSQGTLWGWVCEHARAAKNLCSNKQEKKRKSLLVIMQWVYSLSPLEMVYNHELKWVWHLHPCCRTFCQITRFWCNLFFWHFRHYSVVYSEEFFQLEWNQGCCNYISLYIYTYLPPKIQALICSNFNLVNSVCRDCLAVLGQREDLELR